MVLKRGRLIELRKQNRDREIHIVMYGDLICNKKALLIRQISE